MAEAVAGAAASAVAVEFYKDARGIVGSLQQLIDYENDLDKNFKRLKEESKKLYARRDDMLAKINEDKTKQATKECDVWIGNVSNIEKEVDVLEAKYDNVKVYRGIDHLKLRSNLSKSIKEKCDEVHRCLAEGITFVIGVVVDRPPEAIIKIKAPNIENKPSLHGIIEETLGYLGDEDVKRIGLWGMVGVGKTAILQNLNNNEVVAKRFDMVIFATLTEGGNEEKLQCADVRLEHAKKVLQQEIAQRLKLHIEGIINTKTIASRISKALGSTRYLLILDDVWGTFCLDDIGIQDNNKGSKVVLASRYRDIFHDMDVDEIIPVKPLSTADARKLFFEKLDQNMCQSDFGRIAPLIIKECANLPLVIDRVARTFKKKEKIRLWLAGLEGLRQWPKVKFQGMDEVLERLRYCYEELDDEDKKLCFLYGALYPNGYEIYTDYLLECWRAEGFTHDEEFRGIIILDDLINVSLLEEGVKMKHIRMNKVLRSLALKISSESTDSRYLVRAGENLREPPHEEEWKIAQRISLMDNKLCTLHRKLDCNNLSTLLLQGNGDLTMIPDSFFHSMQSLRVLNLNDTGISSLPSSISCLTCLRALYLSSCNQLMEIPPEIVALEQLEVLDIQGTGISCFPVHVRRLSKLRYLRMSLSNVAGNVTNVEIDQNVISCLSLLEELVIDVHPPNQWWNEMVIVVSEEVATLQTLTSLSLCFPELDSFKNFIRKCARWKEFEFSFQFSIGHYHSTRYKVFDYHEYEICRCLKYSNGEGMSHAISEVLAETNAFELIGHKGPLNLSDFGIDNISKIKSCVIESCPEMQIIIDATGVTKGVLECLERVYISNLPELGSMWKGVVPSGSLAQLTTLSIFKCSKLKKIFSRGMIQQLAKLQHLEVQECDEIEEIVMESENNGPEPGELPSLKTLILHNLPKLNCIWSDNLLRCPSLESSNISECPLLQYVPSL